MSQPDSLGPIRQSFLDLCQPFVHEGRWASLSPWSDIRRPPTDLAVVVTQLQQQYSQAQLVEANVLVMEYSSEAAQLNPSLCNPQTLIVALRQKEGEDSFELLTDQGTLSGNELPICASIRDGRIRKLVKKTGQNVLFVASTTRELAVLLSLGLPATLSSGLAQLGEPYLGQVCTQLELIPQRGIIVEKEYKPPHNLLLVGFSLINLTAEEPPGLADLVSHLTNVEKHLRVPMDRFRRWRPEKQSIEAIAFRLQNAGQQAVRQGILNELDGCIQPLIMPDSTNEMPQDLPTAIEQLKKLLRQPKDKEWPVSDARLAEQASQRAYQERRAWENILQLLNQACITPLFEAATRTDDPLERNLLMEAAMLGQTLYPQSMQMYFKMATGSHKVPVGNPIEFPKIEFSQHMAKWDRMLKILREIQECKKNPYRSWR